MIAMLVLMAAAQAQPGAQVSATATARILPGVRISLAAQTVHDTTAEPQRRRIIRQEAGRPQPLQLIEFQ